MNRWTVVTVAALLFVAATLVNAVWHLSATAAVGGALACVVGYWIVGGCARRGEPLARWLLHRAETAPR